MGKNVKVEKIRDSSLDAICGIFICFMIMGHAFQWSHIENDEFYHYSNMFLFMFMGWFFYKSGMFHKLKDFTFIVKYNARKLLVPYIVYSILGELFYWIYLYQNDLLNLKEIIRNPILDIIHYGSVAGNTPLWFLLSLFVVKAVMALIDKYEAKYSIVFLVSVIIAGGGVTCLNYFNTFLILSSTLH